MTSLNEAWQAQRQQRQHSVHEMLTGFQVERNQISMQLQDRRHIVQDEIRQETRILLADAAQQRQDVAFELSVRLSNFRTQLQNQTAQFLAVTAAERSLMAEQLTDDLGEFHQQLAESVASLRQDLQIEIAAIASDVEMLRTSTQKELTVLRQERLSSLVTLVDGLRADTQDYLAQLGMSRQQRAVQIRSQLQTNRVQRQVTTQTLRQEFSNFQANLRQYRASLRQSVWGVTTEQAPSCPVAPATSLPAIPKARIPLAVELINSPVSEPVLDLDVNGVTPLPLRQVDAKSDPKPIEPIFGAHLPQHDAAQIETDIYTYIRKIEGARLTEIETALGMNRFQTVDALRSLIKKGLVTQRDRTYLAQDQPQ